MTTAAKPLAEIAAQWREARKLYVVYSALLERFALGLPPSRDLESPIDRNEPEAIERIQAWFAQMDERVHVHQLRQLLQTSKLGTEDNLRLLISHHLAKGSRNEADRDKLDFLLVQYLSSCAPPGFYEREVTFDEIAQLLEPVLGEVGAHTPHWLQPLDQATAGLEQLRSLRDLFDHGTLDQMRKLKAGAGEMYFGPTALVAITRFNFMVRRTFVRLIASDLHAIRFSLQELEHRGINAVDCRRAQLSDQEPIASLRQICTEWKKPFRAAYAAGENFRQLIEVRTAVEEALAHAPAPGAVAAPEAAAPHAANGAPRAQHGAHHTPPAAAAKAEQAAASPALATGFEPAAPTRHQAHSEPGLMTAADSAKVEPPPAKSAAESGVAAELDATRHQITQEIIKLNIHEAAVANVALDGVKMMLATWEVGAFIMKTGDDVAQTLQRAVAARAVLVSRLEGRKRGDGHDLGAAIQAAQAESAKIQARIAAAKLAKDIDSAVNLAATSKRLLAVLEEAEKPGK